MKMQKKIKLSLFFVLMLVFILACNIGKPSPQSGNSATATSTVKNNGLASGSTFSLSGRIYDEDTKEPINDALVVLLKPDVTFEQWKIDNFPESSTVTSLTTNATGKFKISNIPCDVNFLLVVGTKDYGIVRYPVGSSLTYEVMVEFGLDKLQNNK